MITCSMEKIQPDDYTSRPSRFDNSQDGHARLYCVENIGTFFPDGNDNAPVTYFRHMNTDHVRFAGMVKGGDGPLSVQTPVHVADLANSGTAMNPYRKISDNPIVYGYDIENPFCQNRYYDDHITWKEGTDGSILDVRLDPFPVAFFIHRCEQFPVSTFYTHAHVFHGTYEGKPIIGIGNDDRQYIPDDHAEKKLQESDYQKTTDYLSANCSGVREDGRREIAVFNGAAGHMVGGYWLEGEDPIVDDNVELIGSWVHLPYVNDGTCVMTDFSYRIGPKTIHFNGKWGIKGWTEKPNIEKHGQSQVLGTFYEGNVPYRHAVWQTFVENMEAYDYKLKNAGYQIID